MRIKRVEIEIRDKLLFDLFKEHILPVWNELDEEEKELVKKFLRDPVEGSVEIREMWWRLHGGICLMFVEYAEKRDWTYIDKYGNKCFIWERYIYMVLKEDKERNILPLDSEGCYANFEKLKKIKEEVFKELKEKEAKDFLKIVVSGNPVFAWEKETLCVWDKLAEKILGREVKPDETLTFEETERIVNYLEKSWKNFLKEAEQKGWIYTNKNRKKRFIWERGIHVSVEKDKNGAFVLRHPEDLKKLNEIKKCLEEIKEKGAERFLKIEAATDTVWWFMDDLLIHNKLASKALGREVKEEEELTIEEALKCVNYLLERSRSFSSFFSFPCPKELF